MGSPCPWKTLGGQESSNDSFIPIKFLIFVAEILRRYGAIGEVGEGAGMCLCVLQTSLSLLSPEYISDQ